MPPSPRPLLLCSPPATRNLRERIRRRLFLPQLMVEAWEEGYRDGGSVKRTASTGTKPLGVTRVWIGRDGRASTTVDFSSPSTPGPASEEWDFPLMPPCASRPGGRGSSIAATETPGASGEPLGPAGSGERA